LSQKIRNFFAEISGNLDCPQTRRAKNALDKQAKNAEINARLYPLFRAVIFIHGRSRYKELRISRDVVALA
jgi:hypothetical protein